MTLHLHLPTKRRVERLFARDLSPKERTRTTAALEQCAHCAAYYRALQAMESSLCKTDLPYTHFSIERTERALFAALDKGDAAHEMPPKRAVSPYALIVATALAALLVFLFLPRSPAPDHVDLPQSGVVSPVTLVARGAFPTKAEADVGIRIFRVVEGGAAVTEGGDLTLDDIITFTYTQANEAGGTLMLLGIQETGEVRWYYPSYGGKESVPVEGDKVDEPLKDGIRLSVNHTEGTLRIAALFSKTPLNAAEVEAAVLAKRKEQGTIMNLSPIVLAKERILPIQVSVIVDIGEGEGRRP